MLTRRVTLSDGDQGGVQVTQRRLVSMNRPHVAALETTLTVEGPSRSITVRSGIDADVTNANVAEYAALAQRHLRESTAWQAASDTLVVETETSQSQIRHRHGRPHHGDRRDRASA